MTPFDLLATVNKTWMFAPGQGGGYSSVNYELLGLVLVRHKVSAKGGWKDYDQLSVIPEALRRTGGFQHTIFPLEGSCTAYTSRGIHVAPRPYS